MSEPTYKTPEGQEPKGENAAPTDQPDSAEDAPAATPKHVESGRTPMVTFCWKDQRQQSFAYAFLLSASLFEEAKGDRIELQFGFATVTLLGRNLVELFRMISAHKAAWIPQRDPATVAEAKSGVWEIVVEPN